MTFTVETGTGVTDANAYVAVAAANTYFAERGVASWEALDADVKQAAIIKATDYVDTRFGPRFLGTKLVTTQGLLFPRADLYDQEGNLITYTSGLPKPFLKAVCEYALRAATGDLWNEPTLDKTGKIVGQRKKVGPIETETSFSFSGAVQQIKPVPSADRLLKQYCSQAGSPYR